MIVYGSVSRRFATHHQARGLMAGDDAGSLWVWLGFEKAFRSGTHDGVRERGEQTGF